MRASRLLSILLLLQARGRMTAEALAAELEVSVRTIYRDIDELSAAEVPVYGDRGPTGGFELLDGYRTKLTGLSGREAAALFLGGLPGPAAELGLADVLTTAQLKLTAALPEGARTFASQVSARFHLDPVGWFSSADGARLLPTIADAVWQANCVDIQYKRYTKIVFRRVWPLGLVLKAGVWYLVAQVGETPRTYRVSNILEFNISDEHFERPKGFDLVRFWTLASHVYETALIRAQAVLRLSPRGLRRLEQWGTTAAQAAIESAGPPDATGWRRAVLPIESIVQGASDLARLGVDAEVVEPVELRELIGESARQLAALYGA